MTNFWRKIISSVICLTIINLSFPHAMIAENDYLGSGIAAFNDRNYSQAIEYFLKVTKNENSTGSNLLTAYAYLSYSYFYNNEQLLASDAAKNVLLIDPEFRPALADPQLGLFYQQVRQRILNNLRVTSQPEGAQVYLDDKFQGKTPLVLNNVDPGLHFFKFKYDKHKDLEKSLYIEPSTVNRLDVRLEKAGGKKWLWYLLGVVSLSSAVVAGMSISTDNGDTGKKPLEEPPSPPQR